MVWSALLALLVVVPDWIVLALAVFSLISGGAAAGGLIWKGLQWIRQGVRTFLKPWTEYPQQIKALQDHDAAEESCNHREPLTPGRE